MLTPQGIVALVAMCGRLKCDPVHLISVAANESGVNTRAHNPHGDASGLWQLMPATAKGIGWDVASDPHLAKFRALPDTEQLHWFEKYFKPATGHLVNPAAAYVWTFLPSLIAHAADPHYKLCGKDGPLAWAYLANTGFDRAKKGCIVVQDLSDAITRATEQMGAEWDMLRYKIRQEQERCKAADGSA